MPPTTYSTIDSQLHIPRIQAPIPPLRALSSTLHIPTSTSKLPTQTSQPYTESEQPAPKRQRLEVTAVVPDEIGELFYQRIAKDVSLLRNLGWKKFVKCKRERDDFNDLDDLNHHSRQLLRQYKHRGAPVILSTKPWTTSTVEKAVERGPHRSCLEHIDFLKEEFHDMMRKGQWIVLPYSEAKSLPNLRISPPGVIPQRGRRPRWICDYSWSNVNQETLPIAPMEAMQFGHAIDRILREILIANPDLGPLQLIKLDISDGFYRVGLKVDDIPKLGVVFPSRPGEEKLVALPLVLPMGWTNSPPIFSAATETAADLANYSLNAKIPPEPHHLDDVAEEIDPELAWNGSTPANIQPLRLPSSSHPSSLAPNKIRDPSLPFPDSYAAYVDVFVDDFIALCQGPTSEQSRVRRSLLHAVDAIFRPLSNTDSEFRREPVSMKKLRQGDCTWATQKLVLGWIINTVDKTIMLPPHRVERLAEILGSIPPTQKRTTEKKWHKVLGELRSMQLALPGAKHLFSQMQLALKTKSKKRISLKRGVHQALSDFCWLASDIAS